MQVSIDRAKSSSIDLSVVDNSIESIEFYEAAISTDETIASNYWYLGVSYLLAGREEDAQSAWMVPLSVATETEIDIYTEDLSGILEREAHQQAENSELEKAWLLRQHLWTIAPDRIDNILQLILIASALDRLTEELLVEWQIDELLETATIGTINDRLLDKIISALLLSEDLFTDLTLSIIDRCLQLTADLRHLIIPNVVCTAFQLFFQKEAGFFSLKLTEICHALVPQDLNTLQVLVGLYSGLSVHDRAISCAEQYYELAQHQYQRLFSSYLIQKSYLTAGNWQNYLSRVIQHRDLVYQVVTAVAESSSAKPENHFIISSFFSSCTNDEPQIDRPLQNQIAKIYQNSLPVLNFEPKFDTSLAKKSGILRIGYLASTLRSHSVGWLSRWLFQYYDRQSFQVFIYCINQNERDPFNHKWFRDKADVSYYFNSNPLHLAREVVTQIKADEIDILIDLDSLTFDLSCQIMAYKPAPIQATWLGFDASGIPAIDYFIVDSYVVAEDAQDYYQEKLWKLPQTYLAVDGFEVGIPNITRQELDIPADAVVYFSSQGGYKRHPDNIRCQMRIIANVPGSYLLIKGKSDPEMVRDLFGKIGEEEGVSLDRLRFLPGVRDEYTHRANLAIADIVLDTFPYNGATTTLETLWMGIPMVTRVGKQFAARNSYTFMLNAGIEEGIAWTEQEYVEWGIRLGLDRHLRLEVREKLRSGRQTAPVWNAQQFTLDMEQAYREMWAIYQQNNWQIGNLHENN
ncbi:O-linked N-acetylglucosamine transferase, SPINDLY family protein [Chamaesiphon polymorphus]|uniref:O-linked N-acetylglucosamine transferase, SPINDLY family protein n=1 Tax=Chamaesiphon polymorphus CCALA 037 TaxID=2107692 RepID=A0A2T1GH69_9CYAN|nr:O-linked N-acetylglucosamine transferase, SPINDLY family protein [Chamaesiphon polymorphus]PSB56952.1 O-linked N-acetylglucosamine transferase, SPINDLY family protein [Chamaesiphon polymorphus CCALA 037]